METLAELQRLRQHLRETIGKLMDEAESQPASAAALAYARIASECQKLDRAIELLSRDVLDQQPPEGIA
jgi:predicted negative regulator of RcsB-dependent stress response